MKQLVCLLLLMLSISDRSQSLPWLWADKSSASDLDQDILSIDADSAGNTCVAGGFVASYTPFVLGSYTLVSDGIEDGFFAKYDTYGNVLWAKNLGKAVLSTCSDIQFDLHGNIYIVGSFVGKSIKIDSTIYYNPDTIVGSSTNFFLIKTDPAGNVLWIKSSSRGNTNFSYPKLTVINNGVIVTGTFQNQALIIGSDTLNSSGSVDIFITKFDENGNILWVKKEGGTGLDVSTDISADNSGNFFISGSFASPLVNFGTYALLGPASATSGELTNFLVKYDSLRNVIWAKGKLDPTADYFLYVYTAIKTDLLGNVFVAGSFSTSLVLDTYTLSASSQDGFVAKWDAAGNIAWASSVGGTLNDWFYGITTGREGNIYVTGKYQSPLIQVGNSSLTNDTAQHTGNMFFVIYDTSGQVLGSSSGGSKFSNENAACIATDAAENIYIGGAFYGDSTAFGAYTLTNSVLGTACFLVKAGGLLATGIQQIKEDAADVCLYPNPSAGQFNLVSNKVSINGCHVEDVHGRVIFTSVFLSAKNISIDIRGNAPGLYFVQITTPQGGLSKKLVLQ